MRVVRGACTATCAAALVVAVVPPALAGADGTQLRLKLQDAAPSSQSVCGVERSAAVTAQEKRQRATVKLRDLGGASANVLGGAAEVRLVIDRCDGGQWDRVERIRIGRLPRKGPDRLLHDLDTSASGDFRLRAAVRGAGQNTGVRSRRAFMRVTPDVVSTRVSFSVANVNRSGVPCASDGGEYEISGRLVAPATALESASPAVTLYLHEFSFGEFFWRFGDVSGYDYGLEMAKAGHTSLAIDRLGYDSSPGPDGASVCLGSQADMAHQIVAQLRSGDYQSDTASPRFTRVALAGHSIGGAIAEIEAYSFRDVDALALFAWADQGLSGAVLEEGAKQGLVCAAGGEPAEPGGPGGYAYFSQDVQTFQGFSFHDADPEVVAAASAKRNRDPCGDVNSQLPAIATNNARVAEVEVPVLLLYGLEDPVFEDPMGAGEQQAAAFSGSTEVTTAYIPNTAHAMTLERTAPTTQKTVSAWLKDRGF